MKLAHILDITFASCLYESGLPSNGFVATTLRNGESVNSHALFWVCLAKLVTRQTRQNKRLWAYFLYPCPCVLAKTNATSVK